MRDFLHALGNIISICVGAIGGMLTVAAAFDWALGKLLTYWRGYKMLIEYAMHHKQFKEWRRQQRGVCPVCFGSGFESSEAQARYGDNVECTHCQGKGFKEAINE